MKLKKTGRKIWNRVQPEIVPFIKDVIRGYIIVAILLILLMLAVTIRISLKYPDGIIPKAHAAEIETESTKEIPNLVVEPAYIHLEKKRDDENVEEDEKPSEKLQYEPITEEKPLLLEKKLSTERTPGAEYSEGKELIVSPEPDFSIKDERIEEETKDTSVQDLSSTETKAN
jgi:hypothetical protein